MTSSSDPSAPGDPSATILESAATGRFRYSPEEREKMLEAYEASGMSGPAFARHCGAAVKRFLGCRCYSESVKMNGR